MKKILTTIIAILTFFLSVFSGPVNKEEAKSIAEKYFNLYAPSTKAGSTINKIITEYYQENESFYIFGFDKGGFVIISADDNAKPILGYSFINPIGDEIGSNTRYLFDRYNKEISFLKKSKTADEKIKTQWEDLRSGNLKKEIKAVSPLLTTFWKQSPDYNALCPLGTPVGCVATAMSQIMNYHEWPVSGNGWHKYIPSDNPQFGIQYANFSDVTYNWANMTNQITESSTQAQIDAISTLCYHAGVSVDMNYANDGSGAQSRDVLYALTSYFKYDPNTIEFIDFNINEETAFIDTIKNEIDNSRPIYYSGSSTDDGGHAWVCDGYDNNNMVHINWGWGPNYTGYYEVTSMIVGNSDFSESNSIIIGIQPGTDDQEMLWTKQASAFEESSRGIRNISAVDKRVAWAASYDGSGDKKNLKDYTRTADGGKTWQSDSLSLPGLENYNTSMITAVDENTAWMALYGPNGGGKIVKTDDGGETWVHQSTASFSAPAGFPNVIYFWDENNGFCQGDPNNGYFEIYTTTNGGETWTRVPSANIPDDLEGEYGRVTHLTVYEDIVWFATNKGRIFKSVDKGNNWTVVQLVFNNSIFEASFRDENNGILLTTDLDHNVLYKTSNGGDNWSAVNYTGSLYFNDIEYIPGTNILITTGSDYKTPLQGISYSTDDGATFTDYADFYKNYQFLSIGVAGPDAVWAGAFNDDQYTDGMWHLGDISVSAGISANKNTSCTNEDIVFRDQSYGSPESWTWNFGDGATPETATGIGPHTVSYSTSGLKNITLTVVKGTDEQVYLKKEFITVSSSIPNDISSITGNTNVVAGEKHTYSVLNQDNVKFIWDFTSLWTGSSTTNEIEIEFTGGSTTSTIKVTPTNGCGDGAFNSIDVIVSSSVGISDLDLDPITIFPNPAKDYINISGIEKSDIYIYDMSGNLVKIKRNLKSDTPVEINNLSSGIYQIKVITSDNIYTKTISVIK